MKTDQAACAVNWLSASRVAAGRNHPLDRQRTGQIARKRKSGVDEEIGVTNSGEVMRRVSMTCLGMMRIDAGP